jgi:hypothetical protein
MTEVWMMGGALMVSFVGAVGVLLWRAQPSVHPRTDLDHAFARAAAEHPTLTATFENAMQAPTLQGTALGVSVSSRQLMKENRGHGQLNARVDYAMHLHLAADGVLAGGAVGNGSGAYAAPGTVRVYTGDADFDRAVFVAGMDPLALLAQLDASRRRALVMARGWRLDHGSWRWELPSSPSREYVVQLIEEGAKLVQAARSQVPTVEGLRALIDDDPLPEVRETVLRTWLDLGTPPEADLRRWASGEDVRALLAAEALGDAGEACLVRLLDHPELASAAAVCIAKRRVEGHEARCEAVLLDALGATSVQADVLEALGRVGGAASVAPLRAVRGALRAEATEAAARIQERLTAHGMGAGAVSIADDGQGGVSLASSQPLAQPE